MNVMRLTRALGILAALAAALAAQAPPPEQKQQRDLKYESGPPPTKPAQPGVTIPRSYALVLGIANYKNLAAKDQLQFSERDAESIYSILISPEGGNFHAENVHKLTGPRATLANMRHELEEWLPATAHDGDRVLIYFAGHGFVFDGRGYLAPYDLDPGNIAATGYPMDTLGSVIGSRLQAKVEGVISRPGPRQHRRDRLPHGYAGLGDRLAHQG